MSGTAKKTSKSNTAPKSSTRKPAAKKTAPPPSAAMAEPTLVNKPKPVVLGPVMRKKELIDTVVTRSGIKKKDAKPVVEAALAVLGEALAEGRELILPPLGKVIVRKEKELPRGKMMIVKLRQSTPPTPQEIAAENEPDS